MKTLVLAKALLKTGLLTTWRYSFNFITQVVMIYVVFLGLFAGAKALGNGTPHMGHTLSDITVGMVVGFASISAFSAAAQTLAQGAMMGSLEQQAMSVVGL